MLNEIGFYLQLLHINEINLFQLAIVFLLGKCRVELTFSAQLISFLVTRWLLTRFQ